MNCTRFYRRAVGFQRAFFLLVVVALPAGFTSAQEAVGETTASESLQSVAKWSQLDARAHPSLNVRLECIDGSAIDLRNPNCVGTVLIFVSTDCPIGNSYQPLLQQLRSQWSQHKLQMIMIHGNPLTTQEQALLHAKEYSIRWPIALDPQQQMAKLLQARNIPEAFVLDWRGNVVYRGRIDDQFAAMGKKRPEPTSNDLRDAVECLLNGLPIAVRETKAVGCVIRLMN